MKDNSRQKKTLYIWRQMINPLAQVCYMLHVNGMTSRLWKSIVKIILLAPDDLMLWHKFVIC